MERIIVLFISMTIFSGTVLCNKKSEVDNLFSEYFEWKMETHPQVILFFHLNLRQKAISFK